MHVKKKLLSLLCAVLLVWGVVVSARPIPAEETETVQPVFASEDTLYFWYADDSLTDYLVSVAASYYEEKGVQVIPVLWTGQEYLEEINDASVRRDEDSPHMPDLYVISNDSLEKAYLGYLAIPIREGVCKRDNFSQTALDAVTYNGKYVAYPFYYETSAFLYNKTYMEEAGREVPGTIDGILSFADEYDAPEQVEAVFKWDVSDIFYNYYFIGNYMDVGGAAGDDPYRIDIDNEKSRACLEVYQSLNQFFSIDTKEVTYNSVLQDFIDGKVVMTVATTDALARLEEAREAGEFSYEYGITRMPDLTEELQSRSLSVTNSVAINGYSTKADMANDFASYLVIDQADGLYEYAGKVSSRYGVSYDNANVYAFMEEYENSAPMPKLLGASNFWVQLEICFSRVWTGEDVATLLSQLAERISTQAKSDV